MSNVLSEQAKQQVIALGRLGWSLRRIQQETGVRRETASVYLKAAGITIQSRGRPRRQATSAKPAITVTTDSGPTKAAIGPSASICEPFREAVELGLRQGRNAMGIWQLLRERQLPDRHGRATQNQPIHSHDHTKVTQWQQRFGPISTPIERERDMREQLQAMNYEGNVPTEEVAPGIPSNGNDAALAAHLKEMRDFNAE